MIAEPIQAPRFIRKTQLGPNEYRKNFRQIDRDAIDLLKSAEAKRVTNLMGILYLTLIDAPSEYWESEGVLRFTGGVREGKPYTAWQQLVDLLDCGNTTAKKALDWMHHQGIIGYYAGKNGVGIRIFINRAVASIGRREGQKNLRLIHTPASVPHTPKAGMPFNDSFAALDPIDTDLDPHAPENGAETNRLVKTSSEPSNASPQTPPLITEQQGSVSQFTQPDASGVASIDEIIRRLKSELEPALQTAAAQAAKLEHERTRDWLDKHGIPKATRVAQKEAYNVLRNHGVINNSARRAHSDLEVGCSNYGPKAVPLLPEGIKEMAEVCITMLEMHGQAIDVTLSQISVEAGGFLLAEDAARVRGLAELMVCASSRKGNQ